MFYIFTHNDLDGYSANLISEFYKLKTKIVNVSNQNAEEEILDFLIDREYYKYDFVFILDILLSKECIEKIFDYSMNFVILDHHNYNYVLNKKKYNSVYIDTNECAASLFYKYLRINQIIKRNNLIERYIEGVRLFDTGKYLLTSTQNKAQFMPEEINKVFAIYRENFPEHMTENFKMGYILSREDKKIAKQLILNEEKYAVKKAKEMKFVKYKNYKIGILFIDQITLLSDVYCYCSNIRRDVDIFVIINAFSNINIVFNRS